MPSLYTNNTEHVTFTTGVPTGLASDYTQFLWNYPTVSGTELVFTNETSSDFGYRIIHVKEKSSIEYQCLHGSNPGATTISAQVNLNEWHCVIGRSTAFNSHTLRVDGAETSSTIDSSPITPDTLKLGDGTTNSFSHDGYMMWATFWDTALSDEECVMLEAGWHPFLVRPGNIVFFAPCDNGTSNVFDLVSGEQGTNTSTPDSNVLAPTGLIYPKFAAPGRSVPAAPSATVPPLYMYYARQRA